LTFCFTVRTAALWADCLKQAGGATIGRWSKWVVVAVLGERAARFLRETLFELFRRL
jgi:hypothetical protein